MWKKNFQLMSQSCHSLVVSLAFCRMKNCPVEEMFFLIFNNKTKALQSVILSSLKHSLSFTVMVNILITGFPSWGMAEDLWVMWRLCLSQIKHLIKCNLMDIAMGYTYCSLEQHCWLHSHWFQSESKILVFCAWKSCCFNAYTLQVLSHSWYTLRQCT